MAVATPPRSSEAPQKGWIERFDGVERVVHWVNAAFMLILIATGAILYLDPLEKLIGQRNLIQDLHVYTGVALPIPLLVGLAGPWGRALRADLRRFNRWTAADRMWLRAARRPRALRQAMQRQLDTGKFNAGQKLNAAFVAGAGLVLLETGAIMRWYHPWPLSWRTGATFVHDWLALAIGIVVIGHIVMALSMPDTLRAMVSGRIRRAWAERHAPAWLDGRD
jgi:formate dehydrogenase subunit gamma